MLLPLLSFAVAITLIEVALWMFFRAKTIPISFPHETDQSSLRFFTFGRLRLLAIAHTLFLIAGIATLFLWLW